MAAKEYNLLLKITASTTEAVNAINKVGRKAKEAFKDGDKAAGSMGSSISGAFSNSLGLVTRLGGVLTTVGGAFLTVGRTLFSVFETVFGLIAKIGGALLSLPPGTLKYMGIGGAALAGDLYATHKALSPAAPPVSAPARQDTSLRPPGTISPCRATAPSIMIMQTDTAMLSHALGKKSGSAAMAAEAMAPTRHI